MNSSRLNFDVANAVDELMQQAEYYNHEEHQFLHAVVDKIHDVLADKHFRTDQSPDPATKSTDS